MNNENDNNRRISTEAREEMLARRARHAERRKKEDLKEIRDRQKSDNSSASRRSADKPQTRTVERTHTKTTDRSQTVDRTQRRSAEKGKTRQTERNSARVNNRQSIKSTKKHKRKTGMYIRLAMVAMVFIAVVALVVSGVARLTSGNKGVVRRAYAKTIKVWQNRDGVYGAVLGNDAVKLLKNGNSSQSFNLELTENTVGANGIGISGEFNKNISSKVADARFDVTYQGTSMAGIKAYTDNKVIMFSAPGIYDKWLKINCDNVMSQFTQSALGVETEYSSDKEFSLKIFDDEQSQGELMLDFTQELGQIYTKEIDKLSKKAKYTKLSDKKAVKIDGIDKNCRGYQLEISGDDFKNFLVNVLSEVRTNKNIRKLISKYAKLQYDNVDVYNKLFDSHEYIVDSYYRQMDSVLERINASTFKDTTAVVYLYKGVIADMDFKTVYAIDKDSVNINLVGGMHGGSKKPYEDITLTLTMADATNKNLIVSYIEETDTVNNTLSNNRSFRMGDGLKDLTLESKILYDKSTNIINGSARLQTPSGGHIDVSGSGTMAKANGTTSITAQEIKLDYNSAFTLVMDGSYQIKPVEKLTAPDNGTAIELFKADKAQIDNIKAEIAKNLNTAVDKVNTALASLKQTTKETNGEETTVEGETSETTTAVETTTTAQE